MSDLLSVKTHTAGKIGLITATGEIGDSTDHLLEGAVCEAADWGAVHLILDLRGTVIRNGFWLSPLPAVERLTLRHGGAVYLIPPLGIDPRVVETLKLHHRVVLEDTPERAMEALRD